MTPPPVKYAVVTFGCRVNQADSFAVEDALRIRGGVETPPDAADLVVVNTCSVTASADQGARQTIRRLARTNPEARIVVTGCYATRRPDEVAALPNVLRVVPNDDKERLVTQVPDSAGACTTAERFGGGDGACGATLEPGVAGRTALPIRVQTGCDERCSYCIIPRTRGAGRSLPVASVLDRIRRAIDAGYKELALTGVHLGSYGRDLRDGTTLERLLDALAAVEGDLRVRISSLEPMDCTPAIVRLVARSARFAPHFHLPLQHGSDRVLRAMRRPYSASFFTGVVQDIAAVIPGAAIGTDAIVGFPGETDEDFERTVACLEGLPLAYAHVFPYSDRPGTEASALSGKVGGTTIRERGQRLREVARKASLAFQARQIGTVRNALTVDDGTRAVTDNYLKLDLPAGRPRNVRLDVRVSGVPGALRGVPLSP
ncbi:MAG: tRNA (N(6)-L-threonylcarbamoyladenosine(37)-C(2))-methylthiotransferase MtaB [Acidimicrobiia bacterium]|nr:tRNA (N(6)-L-threonylcarbamoyladenosine(37)-C(2))-methylthiotransferase MtaB [Acidimicrobiia bacterium]